MRDGIYLSTEHSERGIGIIVVSAKRLAFKIEILLDGIELLPFSLVITLISRCNLKCAVCNIGYPYDSILNKKDTLTFLWEHIVFSKRVNQKIFRWKSTEAYPV